MKIGITGQSGFIGYHLTQLFLAKKAVIIPFKDEYFNNTSLFESFISQCDVIIHLAGINRHPDPNYIYFANIELTQKLISTINNMGVKPVVIYASSLQEDLDNAYGKAKKESRLLLSNWAKDHNSKFMGLIIPNVFGPFGKPFYNSFIATFCHQLVNGEEPDIEIDNHIQLIYVTSLANKIYDLVLSPVNIPRLVIQPDEIYSVSEILGKLKNYHNTYYRKRIVPSLSGIFDVNLFNTYRSFINPLDSYISLDLHKDYRGNLYEVIKSMTSGQLFYSTTKPGITRGNHFHLRKIEKFCVISGKGLILMRKVGTNEILEFPVNGDNPSVVDIPVLFTHNITNIGKDELITLFWSNEIFDPQDTDTWYEEVKIGNNTITNT